MLAGKYPGAKIEAEAGEKIAALLGAGVRTFVDLTEQGELLPYAHLLPPDVVHHRVPIADVSAPSGKQVRAALDAIELGCLSGVACICWGGCGRTGVVVGCYLVEHGWVSDDALAHVYDLRVACSPSRARKHPRKRRWCTGGTRSAAATIRRKGPCTTHRHRPEMPIQPTPPCRILAPPPVRLTVRAPTSRRRPTPTRTRCPRQRSVARRSPTPGDRLRSIPGRSSRLQSWSSRSPIRFRRVFSRSMSSLLAQR